MDTNMTRRALLKMSPIATIAFSATALRASDEAPTGRVDALIEAHRHADAGRSAASKAYGRRYEEVALPIAQVAVGKHRDTGEIYYCQTERSIGHAYGSANGVIGLPWLERRRQEKIEELRLLQAERQARYAESGLQGLDDALGEAADKEFDAFSALINYRPLNVEEMKAKALYLIEITKDDEYDRIGSWHAELLASFAGIEPINPTV